MLQLQTRAMLAILTSSPSQWQEKRNECAKCDASMYRAQYILGTVVQWACCSRSKRQDWGLESYYSQIKASNVAVRM